jgi:hypothetical protein
LNRLQEAERGEQIKTSSQNQGSSNRGPFLYDAHADHQTEIGQVHDKESLRYQELHIVQGEDVQVNIALRNKFEFDLEVSSLVLWSGYVCISY